MEYSCLKTLAFKHKTSIRKIIKKFKVFGGKWGVPYKTKKGGKTLYFSNYSDCKSTVKYNDTIANLAIVYGYNINTLENRLKANQCELCGTTTAGCYEIHHINKVKNLKGREKWEKAMIAKRRKTLIVCKPCHAEIHNKKFRID
jgi:hypothetical protein